MGAIADRLRAFKERREQRRATRRADKPDRALRKREADMRRLEHKRKGGGSGGDGGMGGGV